MSPLKTYIKLQILLLNFLEYLYLYPLCSFTSQTRVQLTIKKKNPKTYKKLRKRISGDVIWTDSDEDGGIRQNEEKRGCIVLDLDKRMERERENWIFGL